jgi:hypothetical protein
MNVSAQVWAPVGVMVTSIAQSTPSASSGRFIQSVTEKLVVAHRVGVGRVQTLQVAMQVN